MSDTRAFDYGPKRGGATFSVAVMLGTALALMLAGLNGVTLGPLPAWATGMLALPAAAIAWRFTGDLRASAHRSGNLRITPLGIEHDGTKVPFSSVASERRIKAWNQQVIQIEHDAGCLSLTSANFNTEADFEAFAAAANQHIGPTAEPTS